MYISTNDFCHKTSSFCWKLREFTQYNVVFRDRYKVVGEHMSYEIDNFNAHFIAVAACHFSRNLWRIFKVIEKNIWLTFCRLGVQRNHMYPSLPEYQQTLFNNIYQKFSCLCYTASFSERVVNLWNSFP